VSNLRSGRNDFRKGSFPSCLALSVSSIPSHHFHIFFITSSYLLHYDKFSGRMGRSLHITIVTIIMGLLLTPAVIRAQSDRDSTNNATIIRQPICKGTVITRHSFNVKLHDQISSIIDKISSEITGSGGRFEGNTKCGCFHGKSALGMIKGEYRSISDTEVEITIEDKPFIIPYGIIESRIKKYLS
jgi:hypothetical protein